MALTEDQAAKIILIRAVEECDKGVFSERILADALATASNERSGVDWIEKRAAYLFERLSPWHQSILQLAKVPANWTFPVCLLALMLGLATNLLGPTETIHVVRNPVFFLVAWNILVYLSLLLLFLLRNRTQSRSQLFGRFRPSTRPAHEDEQFAQRFTVPTNVPWTARHLMPQIWQFVHKTMFGFHQTRNLANLTSQFTAHWFSIAGPLVVARWEYLLHLGALCLATGATLGMYFRGLFQGYEFVWASAFVTDEKTVSSFINVVLWPSFFISNLLNLGLSERVDFARLVSSQGDTSDAWIHLFAITVVITVVIPRTVLALTQSQAIKKRVNSFGLALDDYYGEVIETPIRSIIEKETETAISQFSEKVAFYIGLNLYAEQIIPKLRNFRDQGGRIAELKSDLRQITEAFSPQVTAYILATAIPEFQLSLSQRISEIIRSIGTDFVNQRDSEAFMRDLKIEAPDSAEMGVSDQFTMAIGVSVGATITLTFATVAGGIGKELGIA
ncbi:MAG: DUF2868 domain-containing protein, partial [Candidatus Binatia bacterium]